MSRRDEIEGRRLGYVRIKGRPPGLKSRRALYEARRDLTCSECKGPIKKGQQFTRGTGMTDVCGVCRPWEPLVGKEERHAA